MLPTISNYFPISFSSTFANSYGTTNQPLNTNWLDTSNALLCMASLINLVQQCLNQIPTDVSKDNLAPPPDNNAGNTPTEFSNNPNDITSKPLADMVSTQPVSVSQDATNSITGNNATTPNDVLPATTAPSSEPVVPNPATTTPAVLPATIAPSSDTVMPNSDTTMTTGVIGNWADFPALDKLPVAPIVPEVMPPAQTVDSQPAAVATTSATTIPEATTAAQTLAPPMTDTMPASTNPAAPPASSNAVALFNANDYVAVELNYPQGMTAMADDTVLQYCDGQGVWHKLELTSLPAQALSPDNLRLFKPAQNAYVYANSAGAVVNNHGNGNFGIAFDSQFGSSADDLTFDDLIVNITQLPNLASQTSAVVVSADTSGVPTYDLTNPLTPTES